MSEPRAALNNAVFEGFCRVEEIAPRGMVTLRGDGADPAFAKAVKTICGAALPGTRKIVQAGDRALAWMSPDEWLLILPHGDAPGMAESLGQATATLHALVLDVSDARVTFRVSGPACREVLAKLAPVDLHPDSFGAGDLRRSRLAQVSAAFWMPESEVFEVVGFRSVAQYLYDLLCESARLGGRVGYPLTN